MSQGAPVVPRSGGIRAPALTALEISSGTVVGAASPGSAAVAGSGRPEAPDISAARARGATRAVLEQIVARHLRRGPVAVSFSGGRDSSAVLALAAHVARREGLAPPVPVTFRFAGVPSTHESDWQELVVAHLGLDDWVRLELGDELDLLGEIARDCLLAHGLMWPPNTYLHVPLFRAVRGSTLLTGLDGDGLFGDWRWSHAQAVLHGRAPVTWRDASRVGFALAPPRLRRLVLARRGVEVPAWLTSEGAGAFRRAVLGRWAAEPRRWDARVGWYARARALALAMGNLARVGARHDVQVTHPLLAPEVTAALAAEGGAAGLGDRTAIMEHLFGDVLPAAVVERKTKAVFGGAVWHAQARAFVRDWDGAGCDPTLVIPDRLVAAWREDIPYFASWTLLHAAWLAQQRPRSASSPGSTSA